MADKKLTRLIEVGPPAPSYTAASRLTAVGHDHRVADRLTRQLGELHGGLCPFDAEPSDCISADPDTGWHSMERERGEGWSYAWRPHWADTGLDCVLYMATPMTKRDVVLDAVNAPLAVLGFKKRKGGIFTLELSKEVLGWLGLNRATKYRPAGEVEINPVVGVSHLEIERLFAELRGDEPQGYQSATISTPVGYVWPEAKYRAWVFTVDQAEAVAADMVATIAEHGLPFMQSMVPLGEICRALEPHSKFAIEDYARYRRPIAWLLAGDARRAAEELDKALAVLGNKTDMAANDFRRFADALRARLPVS